MKKLLYLTVAVAALLLTSRVVQAQERISHDVISQIFKDFAEESARHADLWERDLYGAVILIDPESYRIYTNIPDSLGLLTPVGDIYTGQYPQDQIIANTAISWGGTNWAMIMLSSLEGLSRPDRISLMAHELFHVVQRELGFVFMGYNDDNSHLDSMQGRILLKLELEALKKALAA